MIVYPFPPDVPAGYGIAGFDETRKKPCGELYVLSAGQQPPPEFRGGTLFSQTCGCTDERLLQPVQTALPDAPGVWADTRITHGSLEAYVRGLLSEWAERLWMYVMPSCTVFPVPCPDGTGVQPDVETAQALRQLPSHFSQELVCRYSFYLEQGRARVFLFDTEQTCREKLTLLRALGVRQAFGMIPG